MISPNLPVRRLQAALCLALAASVLSGCAAGIVLSRPNRQRLNLVEPGRSRDFVLQEVGQPEQTTLAPGSGEKTDLFVFAKALAPGWKISRTFVHVVLDMATIFLWELVAFPIETASVGTPVKMEVVYDQGEQVKSVQYLK
jgi:hypothetical protein